MSATTTPQFHNGAGVAEIAIGSKEFECIGAPPPLDHPHVFLDMGEAQEITCPYCSTRYLYEATLAPGQARPSDCVQKR